MGQVIFMSNSYIISLRFDTSAGPMIFSNQFLQIASALQNDNIYGLGEHVLPFKLSTQWQLLTLFARDIGDPPVSTSYVQKSHSNSL